MAGNQGKNSRKAPITGGIAGLIIALVAGFFGFDVLSDDPSSTTTSTPSSSARVVSTTPSTRAQELDGRLCPLETLPKNARGVISDIYSGGPFEYPDNDGTRFGNYEGNLPDKPRNYYREYTVETPGLNHRGERRIVTGGPATDPDVFYYTDDHYETFCEVPDA